MDILEQYERALDQTGRIVEGIQPNQLELPTPCTEWNVRGLLNHLIGGNWRTAGVAEGKSPMQRGVPDEDLVGENPAESYRQSADAAKRAWQTPGAVDRLYEMPVGKIPGQGVLQLRLTEAVVHGWDLAKATGQTPHFDADLVETAMTFSEANLGRVRGAGSPFEPPIDVPDDVPAIDRLAALMGRQP